MKILFYFILFYLSVPVFALNLDRDPFQPFEGMQGSIDRSKKSASIEKSTNTKIRVKLTGIFNDQSQSFAFILIQGKTRLISLGDQLEGHSVTRINERGVVFLLAKKEVILELGKEALL